MELSRSEQKRRIKQLEKLVGELVELAPAQLKQLPVDPEVGELVNEARGLKGGARKRQMKYITKLLRSEPVEPLYDFVSTCRGSELQLQKQFHEIEYLRDRLIEEALNARRQAREEHRDLEENWQSDVVAEIAQQLSSVDRNALNQLGFLFAMTRSKKHSREIFRMLQAAREQEELDRKLSSAG